MVAGALAVDTLASKLTSAVLGGSSEVGGGVFSRIVLSNARVAAGTSFGPISITPWNSPPSRNESGVPSPLSSASPFCKGTSTQFIISFPESGPITPVPYATSIRIFPLDPRYSSFILKTTIVPVSVTNGGVSLEIYFSILSSVSKV